jgi:hypothetical protein
MHHDSFVAQRLIARMLALLSLRNNAAHREPRASIALFHGRGAHLCASIERDFSRTRLIAALSRIGQSVAALGKTKDLLSA